MDNPCSDFYRKKYNGLGIKEIKSIDDLQKIPFLTKDEILSVPIEKRIFTDKKNIARYSISSGTTNHKKPLIIPHLNITRTFDLCPNEITKKTGAKKIFILLPPTHHGFVEPFVYPFEGITVIPGNIYNLDISGELLRTLDIDGIRTTPTILGLIADRLKNSDFNFQKIKWIKLSGEICSFNKCEYFKSLFPTALISFSYGMSEFGIIGYGCEYLAYTKPSNFYHVNSDVSAEIIDNKGHSLPEENIGEIVITSLIRDAFPLIRYKTKDAGLLKKHDCRCGQKHILILEGKEDFDMLRFSGITLYSYFIDNSLGTIKEYVDNKFQMHVYEEKISDKIKPKLILWLKLRKNHENLKNDDRFRDSLAQKISSQLKLSAENTFKQLVEKDIFLPLEIKFVDSWPEEKVKTKYIISHLN